MPPGAAKISKFIRNKVANKERPEHTSAKATHQNYALQFSHAKNDPTGTGVVKRIFPADGRKKETTIERKVILIGRVFYEFIPLANPLTPGAGGRSAAQVQNKIIFHGTPQFLHSRSFRLFILLKCQR